MENFDINKALRLQNSGYIDEHLPDPFEGSSSIFNPLSVFSDPLLSDIPALPPSNLPNVVSPALSEEDAAHVDNLVFYGVDSSVLPPDIQTSAPSTAEMPPALASVEPQLPVQPTASSVSPLPVSSALFSPILAPSIPPPAYQRRESSINEPDQPRAPTPGPSSRPTRTRSRAFYPGESSFQLDPSVVAPPRPSAPRDRPVANPRPAPDYLKCKCPGGPTQKPHRHWKSCPSNPDRGQKRFQCEICGERYMTKFSKDRHIKREHM